MTDTEEANRANQANMVTLRGRLSSPPLGRELPSGNELVTFRLVVPRERSPMTAASRQVSDWVDCAVWGGRVRARAQSWRQGDVVEVRGALRRRYFRSGRSPSPATRVEVEVLGGKVLKRAAPGDR